MLFVSSISADGQEDTSGDQSDRGTHKYAFRIGINSVNTDDLLVLEEGGVKLQVLADSGVKSGEEGGVKLQVLADSGVKLRRVVSSYKC